MFKFEKKWITYMQEHIDFFFCCIITFFAILARTYLFPLISGDARICLLPWYSQIQQNGGFPSLCTQVGNYGILYQSIIALITYLPFSPLTAYKITSIIFDFVMVFGCVLLVKELSYNKFELFLTYAIILCSPIVILNSSAWAQCDSMYSAMCIWSIYFCIKEKYTPMILFFSLGLSFKLQAIFLLPVLLFIWYRKKSFSILLFLLTPVTMIFTSIIALFYGRSILDIFLIYQQQSVTYEHYLTLNYPGLWCLFSTTDNITFPIFNKVALLLSLCSLSIILYYWIKKQIILSKDNILIISFLIIYLIVLTMPSMHERYGYLYEILSILLAIRYKRTICSSIALHLISFYTYSIYLGNTYKNIEGVALFNIIIFIYYFWYFNRIITTKNTPSE